MNTPKGGDIRPTGVERLRQYLPLYREPDPALPEEADTQRPQTRADCLPGGCNQARPCPWVSCRHHLAIDVTSKGKVKELWEDLEAAPVTCALDVVDALEDELERRALVGTKRVELDRATVGHYLRLSKDAIQQIEFKALHRLSRQIRRGIAWAEDRFVPVPEGWVPTRREP